MFPAVPLLNHIQDQNPSVIAVNIFSISTTLCGLVENIYTEMRIKLPFSIENQVKMWYYN